jgi:predicted RNase H-like HicB family nuclease
VKDYHINIFFSDEDECYIADIPDLKYCSAHGDTLEEALAEVVIAKQAWLEVWQEDGNLPLLRSTGRLSTRQHSAGYLPGSIRLASNL